MRKPIIIAVLSLSGFISSLTGADELQLQDNPPQQYVVVKGDTLWAIASRYLKDPWRWPELWQMNREQVKNPHLIYPGDLLVLDTSGASPHLRLVKGTQAGLPSEKLSPHVRSAPIAAEAVPTIPPSAIGPFLARALVIEEGGLENAPYVVGPEEDRYVIGRGDIAYVGGVRHVGTEIKDWSIFRPGKALKDPDSNEVLGYEAEYVGEARALTAADPMKVEVTRSVQEIYPEDRLAPVTTNQVFQYIPHAPDKPVAGRIISAYGSISDVGQFASVAINKGRKDGIEEGHVLAVYRKGRTVPAIPRATLPNPFRYLDRGCLKPGAKVSFDQFYDPKEVYQDCPKGGPDAADASAPRDGGDAWTYTDIGCLKPGAKISFDQFFNPKDVYKTHCRAVNRDDVTLPDARTGLVFVYRVFDRVSYALILNSNRPVYLLDVVKNP